MLWSLFFTFMKIGLFSFGGGYAIIPVIEHEVAAHKWMTAAAYADAVSLAGMAPGPIATNVATLVGYDTAGWAGAAAATVGMALPSLIVIVFLASVFYHVRGHRAVASSFYGLKPVVTGLIVYAAIHFGFPDGLSGAMTPHTAIMACIAGCAWLAIMRFRMHPLLVIALSAATGAVLFPG